MSNLLIIMASGEVPRSLFYGDKISLRPAGTATLVSNLDSKCRILRKHGIDGKSFNKPGESASNQETGRFCVEKRYGPLECDQTDCSNAMHETSSRVNIGEFESDNSSSEKIRASSLRTQGPYCC